MKMFHGAALATAIAGSMLSLNANAVNIATDGIGEVAIAPYYTTRGNWFTLINLTNTSDQVIPVKVRLHEGENSRDVYDFTVALSAHDSFTATIREAATGDGPVLVVSDDANDLGRKTCTIPNTIAANEYSDIVFNGTGNPVLFPNSLRPEAYTGTSADGGAAGTDRLREGYVEFIVMGSADGSSAQANRVPQMIEDHECGRDLDEAFSVGQIAETASQFGEPINAIKFNYRLLNVNNGVEAGGAATTWANFFNPGYFDGAFAGGLLELALGLASSAGFDCVPRGERRGPASEFSVPGLQNAGWYAVGFDPTGNNPGTIYCPNLITAQDNAEQQFLEPSLDDAFPPIASWWSDTYNTPLSFVPYRDNLMVGTALAAGAGNLVCPAAGPNAWPTGSDGNICAGYNPAIPGSGDDQGTVGVDESADDGVPVPGNNTPGNVFTKRGSDAVSLTIQRSAVINEWSFNGTGVQTDWVVNFPTKHFYVDAAAHDNAAIVPSARDETILTDILSTGVSANSWPGNIAEIIDGMPYPPFARLFTGSETSCNEVDLEIYDRAEQSVFATVSPSVAGQPALCNETNVISFGANGSLLGSSLEYNVDLSGITNTRGWMRMDMTTADQGGLAVSGFDLTTTLDDDNGGGPASAGANRLTFAYTGGWTDFWDDIGGGAPNPVGVADEVVPGYMRGLPAVGYVVKQRIVGSERYASSMDHAYERTLVYSDGTITKEALISKEANLNVCENNQIEFDGVDVNYGDYNGMPIMGYNPLYIGCTSSFYPVR